MKRKVILALAFVFAAITVDAAPITCKEAAKNVRNFLYGNSAMKFSRGPLTAASPDKGIQPYYIFNIGNNQGFVIASGDDAAYTILGYSTEGYIDVDNIPENMQLWLDGYARDLKKLQKMNLPARKSLKADNKAKRNIPALITTRWAQENPYNKQTPDFNDGYGHRPTGCVATAISQVMNFHQWPQGATGSVGQYEFVDNYSGGDGSTKVVPGLEPTTFDWDAMLNAYDDNSDERSQNAVAELMNYVGRSVKMVYGPYSSGAYATDMIPALVNVFGYKNSAKLLYKEYYSQEGWDDMIYEELSNNRPVIYFGATRSLMGHQFVCDGYENEFFHINWGWAGTSDGYFKLSVLNPDEQGTGGAGTGSSFSEYQNAIFGLEKPVDEDKIYACCTVGNIKDNLDLNVKFDNFSNNFVSAEFDITLPEGFSINEDEKGVPMADFDEMRSDKADHNVKVSRVSEGVYHFELSSPSKSLIIVSSGSLLHTSVKASDNVNGGSYTAQITNVKMYTAAQNEKKLSDTSFNITVNKPVELMYGDANKDGKVTAEDVQSVVDYIMYESPKPFDFTLADVNKDGALDAADVMSILDIVLEASGSDRYIVPTEIDASDALTLSPIEGGLDLNLINKTGYKAVQMDLILPAGIELVKALSNDKRMNGFDIVFKSIAEGRYRMILYSKDGKCITLNEGAVASFITDKLPVEAKIRNIVMVTSDLRKTSLSDVDYKVPTGIDEIHMSDVENKIYTLDGIRVNADNLKKGIYIVNGKKVVVK